MYELKRLLLGLWDKARFPPYDENFRQVGDPKEHIGYIFMSNISFISNHFHACTGIFLLIKKAFSYRCICKILYPWLRLLMSPLLECIAWKFSKEVGQVGLTIAPHIMLHIKIELQLRVYGSFSSEWLIRKYSHAITRLSLTLISIANAWTMGGLCT